MNQPAVLSQYADDIVVVGGAGHVAFPLAIALASWGVRVSIFDVNEEAVATVNGGGLPFLEDGALGPLHEALVSGTLSATTDPCVISRGERVIVVVGTPVDEHLNPDPNAVPNALQGVAWHFRDGQLIVLRSTVYAGVIRRVENKLTRRGLAVDVAFCPERIAEGKALTELFKLPQLVAGRSAEVRQLAASLFGKLTNSIVELEPEEAELAKLFTNTWRYVKFAAANQCFMMTKHHGLDEDAIRRAITDDDPRAADLPSAGRTAGPCLFKDTMQLAAFSDNNFALDRSAIPVNEGLPLYLVSQPEARYDLSTMKVGILWMLFERENDDTRLSLAYKLPRVPGFEANAKLAPDPYVNTDRTLIPLEHVLSEADFLLVTTAHKPYRDRHTRQEYSPVEILTLLLPKAHEDAKIVQSGGRSASPMRTKAFSSSITIGSKRAPGCCSASTSQALSPTSSASRLGHISRCASARRGWVARRRNLARWCATASDFTRCRSPRSRVGGNAGPRQDSGRLLCRD